MRQSAWLEHLEPSRRCHGHRRFYGKDSDEKPEVKGAKLEIYEPVKARLEAKDPE